MANTYKLTNGDESQTTELPLVEGTLGLPAVDVRGLNQEQGVFTYDPGFTATCSCDSDITFIDGENGRLMYRGYSVEDLADKSSYLEVCYLLLNGELPNKQQMDAFRDSITHHTMLNESLVKFYDGFHYDAHPMAILTGITGSLSAFYHDTTDITDPEHREVFAHRMIAKMPTIAAAAYKHSIGQPKIGPKNHLDYTSNLLRMMFAVPAEEYEVDPVAAKALDILFILHADHEQNASTSTVRMAGSTGANPYAAISTGIAALWGPAHGGANEAVLNMLAEIGDASQVSKYIDKAKDKDDPFKLMGFGHRVYKNFDPRAKVIRSYCHEVLEHYNMQNNKLFELALELERVALEDDYFVERKLYPNVDFYSGIIYQALGIPINMFTPMFAIARTVGWAAHWSEMMADPKRRIARPRQVYTGYDLRDYVDIDKR
ncbi:citrate synthase [Salinisphaera hydrothermalis]|uniref:Citrate synthase n=1 Tax=Salinisphaera hydrothermalis (strain C41B8) TaxID=1304275 RepID=A0A084IR98_SALHC|nr:citrate synthase [Salinisphaera hydrothermalis]KEZ79232.1 citrate synthase I, hexameric type [Salinisphaera hydrothermalis C41B8]